MTDTTQGSAAAVVADTQATQTTTTTGATGTTQTTTAVPSSEWTKGWDPVEAGTVEKKGWKTPQDLFKSYANLEKLLGDKGERLPVPKGPDDVEAIGKLYDTLGRPKDAAGYKAPEGVDPTIFKEASTVFHDAGLNQGQVDKLLSVQKQINDKAAADQKTALDNDIKSAQQKLKAEWGNNFPRESELALRAERALGIDATKGFAAMQAMGAETYLKLLAAAGHSSKEDNSGALGEGESTFGLSANRAAAEKAKLMGDKNFAARYLKGEKQAVLQVRALNKIITPE